MGLGEKLLCSHDYEEIEGTYKKIKCSKCGKEIYIKQKKQPI